MLSQKQKKDLIRELDSFASPPKKKSAPKKRSSRQTVRQASRNLSQRGPGRGIVGPSQRGISNVLGQRSDIPLKQPFNGSESLGRFNGSLNFTETQFAINPGQAVTFPWLSQEAKLWEKYEFDKLEFEFRTTINEFSANAFGRVILGVDYDASDPPPSSRSQAEISRPVTAQAPYFNQRLVLRKEDMHDTVRKHYVRPGNLPGSADIKMYDVGVLNFGTDGNINANEVGELWVHYSGMFHNQVLESISTFPANFSVSQFQDSVPTSLTTTVAKNLPLASAGPNGLKVVNTSGSLVPPAGNYLLTFSGVFTDTSAEAYTAILDLEVDGATEYVVAPPEFKSGVSLGAGEVCTLNGSLFLPLNGTNAVTLVATMTGAAGTLTCSGVITLISV